MGNINIIIINYWSDWIRHLGIDYMLLLAHIYYLMFINKYPYCNTSPITRANIPTETLPALQSNQVVMNIQAPLQHSVFLNAWGSLWGSPASEATVLMFDRALFFCWHSVSLESVQYLALLTLFSRAPRRYRIRSRVLVSAQVSFWRCLPSAWWLYVPVLSVLMWMCAPEVRTAGKCMQRGITEKGEGHTKLPGD